METKQIKRIYPPVTAGFKCHDCMEMNYFDLLQVQFLSWFAKFCQQSANGAFCDEVAASFQTGNFLADELFWVCGSSEVLKANKFLGKAKSLILSIT